jgi:hypothetical protein
MRGSLQGLEGILVPQKGLCRVIISIEMLAKSFAVEVDVAEIGPAHRAQFEVSGVLGLIVESGVGASVQSRPVHFHFEIVVLVRVFCGGMDGRKSRRKGRSRECSFQSLPRYRDRL